MCVFLCVFFFSAKEFLSDVSIAVVGHWSKDNFDVSNFNFSYHSNALQYAMTKRSSQCTHQCASIQELLRQFLSLLSFPGQTILEFFPQFACGKSIGHLPCCHIVLS